MIVTSPHNIHPTACKMKVFAMALLAPRQKRYQTLSVLYTVPQAQDLLPFTASSVFVPAILTSF
jgi:hypothetical protein